MLSGTTVHKQRSIEDVVIEIVSEQMGVNKKEFTRDVHFANDLGCDSLDLVELVMEFEDEFELSVPDEDAEKVETVGQAIDYIETALKNEGRYQIHANPEPHVHIPRKVDAKPIKQYNVADDDYNVNGDVTRDLLPSMSTMRSSAVLHLAVGCKVYHAIHHYDEKRLEIIERPDLCIYGKPLDGLVAQAVEEIQKPY